MEPIKIAVFASGSGSNAEKIISYFKDHRLISVALVVSNRKTAGVVSRAENLGIPVEIIARNDFSDKIKVTGLLDKYHIDAIILAGFLLLIPDYLIAKYPDLILNIHPALLPKYGGHGMYGQYVHEAVFANNETVSGMTVHLVNEQYDKGQILAQYKTSISPDDTPQQIADKVLRLEHEYYPVEIEKYLLHRVNNHS